MIGLYLGLIRGQDGQVAVWFVVALAVAALLSIYGVARWAPHRGLALAVSGVVMAVLGVVSLLTIGFPILVAGVVALLAAARAAGVASRAVR